MPGPNYKIYLSRTNKTMAVQKNQLVFPIQTNILRGLKGDTGDTGSKGDKGDGFTGGSYDPNTGEVTFASNDGLGFSTGDLRGTDGTNGTNGTDGDDGKEVEIQNSGTYIQWRYVGDSVWINLVSISSLKGDKGDTGDGFTGGSYSSGTGKVTFTSNDGLGFVTGDLRGSDGTNGKEVEIQNSGTYIQWRYVGDPTWENIVSVASLKGDKGDKGDTGIGTPTGGTTGQFLKKDSDADYDFSWDNPSGMQAATYDPAGGAKQVAFSDEVQVKIVSATSSTGASTKTKVASTSGGSYSPTIGDLIVVAYSSGTSSNSVNTLNIDGSGAKNITLAGTNANSTGHSTASGGSILYYYDGSTYNIVGSQQQANTTYSEISEGEIDAGTSGTGRTISGRRSAYIIGKANSYTDSAVSTKADSSTLTSHTSNTSNPHSVTKSQVGLGNVTNDAQIKASDLDTSTSLGSSDTKVPSQNAVKTYVDNGFGGFIYKW